MGVIDKLKFWKHEPHLDLDSGVDLGTESFSQPNLGLGQPTQQNPGMVDPMAQYPTHQPGFGSSAPSFANPSFEQPRIIEQQPQNLKQDSYDKNLEIVSMKLDNLKVAIENMNQRLINIERIATDSLKQEQKRPRW